MSRRLLVLSTLAAAVLIVGSVTPAYAADPDDFSATPLTPSEAPIDGAKTKSGQLAQSDTDLLARSDAAVVPVMVKVDVDPVASYTGDIEGLAATSPEVTGTKLSMSDPAVVAYQAHVQSVLSDAAAAIAATVPSATVTATYDVAYGGFAMTVAASDAKALLGVAAVTAVQDNTLRQIPAARTDSTSTTSVPGTAAVQGAAAAAAAPAIDNDASTFIGADAVWPSLGGRDRAGEGVIVGVIDTGIWPEHPMLADNGIAAPAGGPWDCDFGDGDDAAFACNDKLIGAYAFLDAYQSLNTIGAEDFCSPTSCSARDSEGHGTHTATTAAGSYVESAPIFGVNRGPVSGIAPGASIIAYRALGPAGGYNSDLVAAVQQTILDGVDVINYSVSGSQSVYSDPVELAFLDAYAAGITVNASAGNSGPGASTADHAGPWVTTVGASTFDRAYTSTLTLTATDGTIFSKSGATLTDGVEGAPAVLAADVPGYTGGEICATPFPAGSLTGQVVVCRRGGTDPEGNAIGRVQKGFNALQGGAAGMILYNPAASDVETDNHFLPTIHLEGPNDELLAFLAAHPGSIASWAPGAATQAQGDVMAGFSSRGPIGEFLKPDVTAPGVQVLAGHTPQSTDIATGPQGELYQAIAGTSMSSPHAAGVSALVKAAHPTWTPGQIKSALMTSSVQSVVNVDGSTAGVFDRGAGSIRADRAVTPTLTISETADAFYASAANPVSRLNLNIPSILIDPLPGAAVVTRTVTNVTDRSQVLVARGTSADGVALVVTPAAFTLGAGKSRQISVIVDGTQAADGWHEGQVTITSTRQGALPVVIPVAADVGDAQVTLSQSCSPTEIARYKTTTCSVAATNFLPVPVPVQITVAANPLLQVKSVTPPATRTLFGAKWSGTLSAAKPPTIESIVPGTSPAEGYLPLSAFGIAPIAGIGDESVTNFDVPSFLYGGETYTRLAVDSNGYVVVGGGTGSDNLLPPNGFPNPEAPNNVLAPFWTDLNPAAGGGVRLGTLTDGTTSWLIVDWEDVPTYAGNATNTFQVWIQLGATEGQWFSYGAPAVADADTPGLVGAENRDGTSGIEAPIPTAPTEYAVTTGAPAAGGTVSFDYTLKGLLKGSWSTSVTLRSPALSTIPAERTIITVK